MSETKRVGDLDIGQDLTFQQRSWMIQRIGWLVMLSIIVAGLFGVFGHGLAAEADAGEENSSLRVEYQRFVRVQSPTTLVIRLGTGADRVRLSREYLEAVQIESVSPTPAAVEAAPGEETYVFTRAAGTGDKPLTVTVYFQAESAGVISGTASAGDAARDFRQYVYP